MKKHLIYIVSLIAALLPVAYVYAEEPQNDDLTAFPYDAVKSYWSSANGSRDVNLDDAAKSPVYDLRNKLTGIVPGLEVVEEIGSIMPDGNLGSASINAECLTLSSHGFSNIVLVVDDVLIPFNQYQFDLEQVESISLLTDASAKAIYGPAASGGVLYIRTKKGNYNTPLQFSADFRTGINLIDRMPEWVNGTDYASLNNMARMNDSYPTLYDEYAIEGFSKNDMFNRQYPNVDYRKMMIRNYMPTSSIGLNMHGGSNIIKYNLSLSGLDNQDLYNVGPATDFNRINLGMNITAKIGNWIEASVSFNGLTGFKRDNYGSFDSFQSVPAIAFPVALGISTNSSDLEDVSAGNVIYAVSKQFPNNPYAKMVDGGFFTQRMRSADFNASIDVNLGFLVKGLKSKTFVSFNNYYYQKVGKENDYIAYFWDSDSDIGEISSHVGTKQSSKSSKGTFTYQSLSFFERLYYNYAKNGHKLDIGLTFNLTNTNQANNSYYERQANITGDISYSYKDRYIVEAVLQEAGSSRLAPGKRYAFFPSVSAAWVASNEDFLKDNETISRLKLHAGAGILGESDIFGSPYLYNALYSYTSGNYFGPATAYQWFGTDKRESKPTTIKRLANENLGWGKIYQFDAGVDIEFCKCLSVSLDYFRNNRKGIFTDASVAYAAMLGLSEISYYDNFDETLTNGMDAAIRYSKKFGDWKVAVGGNISYWKTKLTKVADNNYLYDWQNKEGSMASDYRGFICDGKFTSEEEIATSPLYDADTRVGDLKYRDLNRDGLIDANDKTVIGHTDPLLRYAVNVDLSWKNLSLFVVGTGRALYDIPLTNKYFWNGWGDENYSAFVAENLGGDYPRLGYDKSVNNFTESDFWLRDGSYFKIQTVELAYTLPFKAKCALKSLKLSLRGSNLATFSKIKYVDPENIDAGVSTHPLYRTIAIGAKLNF